MPGRRSTGPPSHTHLKSKKKTKKRTLNALAIAEHQTPDRHKIRKGRLGEIEHRNAKRQWEESEDSFESGDDPALKRRKLRAGDKDSNGNEIEGGSDSEGNEWVTGAVASDDDSSINSDEATGQSDDDRFGDFTFRGSSNKGPEQSKETGLGEFSEDDYTSSDGGNESVDHGRGVDGSLPGAIDLASVLDTGNGEEMQSSKGSSFSDDPHSSSDEETSELSISDDGNEGDDVDKFSALKNLVSSMDVDPTSRSLRSQFDNAQEASKPSEYGLNPKQKLTVADLLPTIKESKLRRSLKMMADEGKKQTSMSQGVPGKLEVPLAKRQQDRLDRAAAFEKSKETLNRWVDTVKHNRRAEHLIFPLPAQDSASAKEAKKLSLALQSKPATGLESTIQNILVESGLASANGKSQENQIQALEESASRQMPFEEVQARRAEMRRIRELLFREEIRAKRIKKIKSKTYRRVHRKERERNALANKEALTAAGVELSEDEQEHLDRLRAEERMGARHRESKWAKRVKDIRRATWDENARSGVTEMARRNEELLKRIQGKDVGNHDSIGSGSDWNDDESSDEEDDDIFATKMRHKLGRLRDDGAQGANGGVSSLKFMQKAEAARKAQNDEAIEKLRRELANEDPSSDESEVRGRRRYGPEKGQNSTKEDFLRTHGEFEVQSGHEEDDGVQRQDKEGTFEGVVNWPIEQDRTTNATSKKTDQRFLQRARERQSNPPENPWLSTTKQTSRSESRTDKAVLISTLPETIDVISKPTPSHTAIELVSLRNGPSTTHDQYSDSELSSFAGFSPPLSSNKPKDNATLIRQAFASDDVLVTEAFASEKAALAAAEEPTQRSSTKLPGWGAWVGVGLSKKDKHGLSAASTCLSAKRDKDLVKEGVPPERRKDCTLSKVIVSEKRLAKSAKYLASSLPHPFETKAQYERSLRLPVGQEWTTKEVFQEMTKPRVMIKGGIIAPIRKPLM